MVKAYMDASYTDIGWRLATLQPRWDSTRRDSMLALIRIKTDVFSAQGK
jgi:hypothetical protein